MIEIRHLRLMVAVAQQGSLTAVARGLGLTQPALSRQLRELEVWLRAPLFERTARRMVLTPAGEELTATARRVLAEVESVERQIMTGECAMARGRVRVATECYTAYHWLPRVLRDFQTRWPNVDLIVTPEHTAAPIAALRHNDLDVALVYHRGNDPRIRFERLFDDEVVVVTSPDHRFARSSTVRPSALADEHVIVYGSLSAGSSVVRDILNAADVEPAKITQVQLTEAILELVAAGLGVALLARWAVAPAVKARSVHVARLGKHGYRRTWYAAVRAADVRPNFQFDLIDLLRRHLSTGAT
jgi:LysR family transcriptional regulator, regulator for metE and metH